MQSFPTKVHSVDTHAWQQISDPKNRAEHEAYIEQLEAEKKVLNTHL